MIFYLQFVLTFPNYGIKKFKLECNIHQIPLAVKSVMKFEHFNSINLGWVQKLVLLFHPSFQISMLLISFFYIIWFGK